MALQIDESKLTELAADPAALATYVNSLHDAEVRGLVGKRDELLGTVKSLEGLKGYKSLGKTPEEIAAELEEARKLREEHEAKGRGVANEEVEKLAEERANKRIGTIKGEWEARDAEKSKALKETADRAAQLEEQLKAERLDKLLMRAVGDSVYPEVWDDFTRKVAARVTWNDRGNLRVIDPESGVELTGKDGAMTLEELVEDMSRKFKPYFRQQGAGSPAGTASRRVGPVGSLQRSKMSTQQKAAYVAEHGEAAFRELPA